jgi:hypothetical protein
VPEPSLDGTGVVTLVREGIATGVAEHVRVSLERKTSGLGGPFNHPGEAGCREWGTSLADEDEWRRFALPLEPPQGSQFITPERMSAGGAILDPADVEDGGAEPNLIPAQVAQFGRSQPVPKGDQDHGGVPVPVPICLGGLDQSLYFARRYNFGMKIRSPGTATVRILDHVPTAAKPG